MTQTWLSATAQRWKIRFFLAAMAISILLIVASLASTADPARFAGLLAAGIASGVAALAWICLAIRCPSCGGLPAWWALRKEKSSAWFVVLVSAKACPICGAIS